MKLVILTNIPTPYRTAFFDRLAARCASAAKGFHVLYCGTSEKGRHWACDRNSLRHDHTFLSGVHPRIFGTTAHFNPGVVPALNRLRPDVLICAGAWITPTVLLSGLANAPRRIFWSEGHADAALHPDGLIAWARRLAYRSYDAFAVPNQRSADWAILQCGEARPLIRLPNAIDALFYRRPDVGARLRSRAELGIPPEQRIIVQVSSLTPRKGVMQLAEAFLRRREACGRSTALLFAGTGELDAQLRTLSKKTDGAIRLLGHLDAAGIRSVLHAADVFALNSFLDPNPLSPVEAAAAGLPLIISAKAGNVDELASFGVTISDPSDPSGALEWGLRSEEAELTRLGERAAVFAAGLDVDAVALNLLADLGML